MHPKPQLLNDNILELGSGCRTDSYAIAINFAASTRELDAGYVLRSWIFSDTPSLPEFFQKLSLKMWFFQNCDVVLLVEVLRPLCPSRSISWPAAD